MPLASRISSAFSSVALSMGLTVALAGGVAGCGGSTPQPRVAVSEPSRLCSGAAPARPCLDPREVEQWMVSAPLTILGSDDPPAGKQEAKVLTLAADLPRGHFVFRAKWRAASTAHQLNSPRKEVAAHAVQKLLLAPEDWVVPPAAGRCFPLEPYRRVVDPAAQPSFRGGQCVLGFLSYWLEDARSLDGAEDEDLIDDDTPLDPETARRSASFRQSVADVNLLAHLISHGDSHPDQFVVTGTREAPAVHLVDNTIAFSHYRNPGLSEEWDWSRLQVPAVRKTTTDRMAKLTAADLDRLLVFEQHAVRGGLLVPEPQSAAPDTSPGGIAWVGDRLQVGLTRKELELLRDKIGRVLAGVASGQVRTF
jgi:hypothetical protein